MANSTYYVQECPTCGRRLQIRVEYLGRRVVCQHCHGAFIAADPAMRTDCSNRLLKRADELLATVAHQQGQSRLPHPR
jgi:DNA-directed RNA polymerase subunit RPC12/RpoP